MALALGEAFAQALGDRKGIVRMASFTAPMDDSLAIVTVDLSGRPYAVVQAEWRGPSIGALPTSLVGHFLESFAFQARCNLHVRVLYGRDDHHQAEALFKALGRALDAAAQSTRAVPGRSPRPRGWCDRREVVLVDAGTGNLHSVQNALAQPGRAGNR